MKTNRNEPAFPLGKGVAISECFYGLTKREHFAGLAMASLAGSEPDRKAEFVVKQAVDLADALIAELNKQQP